jgi:DNA-binding GntR family transcriptional regulator
MSDHAVRVGRATGGLSLADTVFETIKRQIVEYRLLPETILSEATLAAAHDVSRAPAREALQRLEVIGFVRAVPRVGYIVARLSVRDFDEIFAMRLALEPLATEFAVVRMRPGDLDRLGALARAVLDVPKHPHDEQGTLLVQLNTTFHREIARIAGNQRMERTITGLLDELERLMHMLAYSKVVVSTLDEHPALIAIMSAGDAQAAGRLMREQLQHDYTVMRDLAAGAPDSAIGFPG